MDVTFRVWISLFVFVQPIVSVPSNNGRQFLVVFIESIVNKTKQDLVISTMSLEEVTVKISAPLRLDLPPVSTFVTQGNSSLITVANELNVFGTGISNNGILIESDGQIAVQGYSQSLSSTDGDSTGGFQALPFKALGTEYMVTSYCETYVCQVAITAAVNTSVRVQFKLAPSYTLTYNLVQYGDGDVLTVGLLAYQVLQLQITTDMSGTIITSKDKVAVFVGSDWTPIMPYRNDRLGDFMVEQMPPLNTWGCSYIVTSFPGRSSSDLVTIVAAEDTAEVTDSSGTTFTIGYRNRHTLQLPSGTSRYFTSTSRIIVAQFTMSSERFVTDTDPSMLLVPPIDQWRKSYAFEIIDLPPTNFVTSATIFTSTACVGVINFADNEIPSASWSEIQNTEFVSATFDLSTQAYWIGASGNRCRGFSGYIYRRAYKTALSFALGGNFQVINADCMPSVTTSSSTTTSTASPFSVNSLVTAEVNQNLSDIPVANVQTIIQQTSTSFMEVPRSSEVVLTTSVQDVLASDQSATESTVLSRSSDSVQTSSIMASSTQSSQQAASVAKTSEFSVEALSASVISSPIETQDTLGQVLPTPEPSTLSTVNKAISAHQTASKALGAASAASLGGPTADSVTVSSSILDEMSVSGSISSVYHDSSAFCSCSCKPYEHTKIDVDVMRRDLAVDKAALSKTIRKRISIPDERPSAVTLGWVGIVFIITIILFFTVPDMFRVLVYVFKPRK